MTATPYRHHAGLYVAHGKTPPQCLCHLLYLGTEARVDVAGASLLLTPWYLCPACDVALRVGAAGGIYAVPYSTSYRGKRPRPD